MKDNLFKTKDGEVFAESQVSVSNVDQFLVTIPLSLHFCVKEGDRVKIASFKNPEYYVFRKARSTAQGRQLIMTIPSEERMHFVNGEKVMMYPEIQPSEETLENELNGDK